MTTKSIIETMAKIDPHYAVLDVETTRIKDGEVPTTLFWGYADRDGYRRFDKTWQLVEFLEAMPTRHVLHHTNYDLVQLLLDGYRGVKFVNSHNGKFIVTSVSGKHTFLNSYAMFPVKLEEIFKVFGYAKTSLDDLDKRNYEDCVWGLDCMLKLDQLFMDLVGQSPLRKHTIASTAFAAAEAEAGKMPKDIRYLDAYRGGRVDVFDTNEHEATRYDINSSYPYSFLDAPTESNLLYCEVRSDCHYGPFVHADTMDRLLFPSGKFRTYIYDDVFGRYIEPSRTRVSIQKVLSSERIDLSWLKRVVPVIQKFYNLKLGHPKTSAQYLIGKLGINALYGRTGMKGVSEKVMITKGIPDKDNVTAAQLPSLDARAKMSPDFLIWFTSQREPRSNYPLAAYITDNGRGRLYSGVVKTNGLYCDTDSVDTIDLMTENLGTSIGQWKDEGSTLFQAHNLKDYHRAGVRHVKGGEVSLQWTLKKMASGQTAVEVRKNFSTALRKRVLESDGTTRPIHVES